MRNFLLIAQQIPVQPLLVELARQPQLWDAPSFRKAVDGTPFPPEMDDIVLRCQPMDGSTTDHRECVWTEASLLLPAARPLILALMAQVGAERLGRCLLDRLPPGGRITPHADIGDGPLYYDQVQYWARHHVVLTSEAGNWFRCGDEVQWMRPGECWWFNNALEHEVWNDSEADRIHLLVDCHCFGAPR